MNKQIIGTNYTVDEEGVVRKSDGTPLKATIINGYETVMLFINKKPCRKYIHRLVADCFLPKVQGGEGVQHVVHHINGDISDNRPSNLEWVLMPEAIRKSHEAGSYDATHQRAKVHMKLINARSGGEIEFTSITECAIYLKSINEDLPDVDVIRAYISQRINTGKLIYNYYAISCN